jgi:hypothetical protein
MFLYVQVPLRLEARKKVATMDWEHDRIYLVPAVR